MKPECSFLKHQSNHKLKPAVIAALGSVLVCGLPAGLVQAQQTADTQEIIIYGTSGRMDAVSGSRMNLGIIETPATVDVIDGDAIRDRIDLSVIQAVTRSAGFTEESNPGNGHFSIGARGFSGQNVVTKLYDSTQYFTIAGAVTFPFDTWGIERIEVLKGPASVLYGQGGIGGAINIIPTRPEFTREGNVRIIAGQDSSRFLGLDYTDALTESVAFRVNYSHNESDNWVNNGESKSDMLSAALTWQVNEDLSLTARYDRGDQEPMRYFGSPLQNGDFIDDFIDMNFNVDDAEITYEDESLRLRADWRISETVQLQADVFRLNSDRFWKNAEGYVYDAAQQLLERWDPLIIGHDIEHDGFRSNLVLTPANSRLKTSIGFEVNDISFIRPTNYGPANHNPINWDADFDIVDPYNFQPGSLTDLTEADTMLDNWSDTTQWALFSEAQYQLTDRLALVGGLRYDDFDTHYERLMGFSIKQQTDVVTGRLGAVYDLNDTLALYGQYSTGADHPSSTVVTVSGSFREADLVETEQIEIGIKKVVAGTGLQWSAALFDITRNNLTENDPDSNNPDDVVVVPKQTSRGLELGLNYAFTNSLQVYGNLAVMDAETDTGETPSNIAETSANLGFAWHIKPELRVLADARYVDERYHANLPLKEYTVVDASLRWAATDDVSLTLKVDNLLDERYASGSYWWGTWIVGKPRTFSLAADYSF